tara:strand:+ start:251 stop:517 length:267 start_codon:yes stop_codon:yes gene_type:complete
MDSITEKEFEAEDPKFYLVKNDTELKDLILSYVGSRLHPHTPEVTVEEIVNIFAEEFPEFLLVIAQENFLRGYAQGLEDSGITYSQKG